MTNIADSIRFLLKKKKKKIFKVGGGGGNEDIILFCFNFWKYNWIRMKIWEEA